MPLTRREAIAGCGGAMFLLTARPAPAQAAYPGRTIKMLVPYPAGGTTDLLGRLIADQFKSGLAATVVVENKPGAGTTLGADQVAKSEPDGYTLLMATSTTLAINKTLYKNLPYDPVKDFAPIGLVAGVPFALIINPSIPAKSLVRIHCLRQIEAGPGLWLGRQRQPTASRRRNAQDRSRDRYPPCAVSRQRPGDARRDRGAYPVHDGRPATGSATDPRGQGQGARRDHAETGGGRARYPDHRRRRAGRDSNWSPGRAWLRPQARRGRSSTNWPRRSKN